MSSQGEYPWTAERRIESSHAGTLANQAFGLACKNVEKLGEGFDFVNYLADRTWVLRFPKRAECDGVLVREKAVLARLQDLSLPVRVPSFEHFSSGRGGFPWHFAAYRFLEGKPLSHIDDETIVRKTAPAIGEFLAALHRARLDAELPSPWEGDDDGEWTQREFARSVDAYPHDLRDRIAGYLRQRWPDDPDVPRVLAHADMMEDHILVDPGTGALTGVIDWADACTTIRCADFAGLFYARGRAFAERTYAAYGAQPDADEWRSLEHTAIVIGLGEVHYGYFDNHPGRVVMAFDRIRRYLP